MIEKLKQIFSGTFGADTDVMLNDQEQTKKLAAVALMVEIIAVDDEQHDAEKNMLRQILVEQFEVTQQAANALITNAEQAHEEATDFFRFTSEINEFFDADEKIDLIESFWKLAWADQHIHDLEQHVIRRLANLLHVSHKDFIAAKIRVVGA
ncbi:TerB family tellurite resistance protein [Methylophaga thiooxydans]|uniref:tellurite resistance TerB family protein n=1 Tax=Methylophaga thiooxydans TaxID=392484 RepID=UPI002354582F|nr:TerB family tellurite resistance protein [Methylophaga thiooxydans]